MAGYLGETLGATMDVKFGQFFGGILTLDKLMIFMKLDYLVCLNIFKKTRI